MDYSLDELIWNNSFRQWVLTPDAAADVFWNNWITAHPERQALADAAKEIVLSLTIKEPVLTHEATAGEIQNILDQIREKKIIANQNKFQSIRYITSRRLAVAALFVLIVSAGFFFLNRKPAHTDTAVAYRELVKSSDDKLTEKINKSGMPQNILLSDGSSIVLEKNARISYLASFTNISKREVYLSGNAFFDIAKDPSKPFLVYTNGLITKVLGTKFLIHSTDSDKKVSVEVMSGMVSVYSYINNNSRGEAGSKKINSLILTPNQKANYSGEDKTLVAAIVENPVIVSPRQIDFMYEDTPIDSVFKSIKTGYGIEIIYDEKSLAKRTFTATLTSGTLYEKMDIICKALGCRYEMIDGKIVVYSNVE